MSDQNLSKKIAEMITSAISSDPEDPEQRQLEEQRSAETIQSDRAITDQPVLPPEKWGREVFIDWQQIADNQRAEELIDEHPSWRTESARDDQQALPPEQWGPEIYQQDSEEPAVTELIASQQDDHLGAIEEAGQERAIPDTPAPAPDRWGQEVYQQYSQDSESANGVEQDQQAENAQNSQPTAPADPAVLDDPIEIERLRLAERRQKRLAARQRTERRKRRWKIRVPKFNSTRVKKKSKKDRPSSSKRRQRRRLRRPSLSLSPVLSSIKNTLVSRWQNIQHRRWRKVNRRLVGLDIGAATIKALALDDDGAATIHQKLLPPGVIINGLVEEPDRLAEALSQLWKEAGIKSKKVNVGLKNKALAVRVQETAAQQEKDVRQVVALSSRRAFSPLDPDKLVVDYRYLSRAGEKNRLLVAAADRQLTNNIVNAVKKAGLAPICCEIGPLASQRTIVSPRYPRGLHLLVDIGAESTSLLFCSGPDVHYLRILELGGNDFTQALVDNYSLTWMQAEERKRQLDLSSAVNEPEISALADRLINEIERTVQEAEKSTERKVKSWTAVGGGAQLAGLIDRIDRLSNLPEHQGLRAQPGVQNDNLVLYSTVIGLASDHQISLLPPNEGRYRDLPGGLRHKPKVQLDQSLRHGKRLALGGSLLAAVDPRLPALALAAVIAFGAWFMAGNNKDKAEQYRQQIANERQSLVQGNLDEKPLVYTNSSLATEVAKAVISRPAGNSVDQSATAVQEARVQGIRMQIKGSEIIIDGRSNNIDRQLQQKLLAIPGVTAARISGQGSQVKIIITANGFTDLGAAE